MATDQRISALPSVTSPSSTDVLPIVSAGITSQVTVSNLHSTLATTGSNTFVGTQIIDGNLTITGTTTLGGNIVPAAPRGATLGTLSNPFGDIFVSSGSINIAGIPGQPNTTLSNVSGNILISAGGMQLVGTGSFNAVSASFSYLSGTFTHIGSQFNIGDTVTTGSLQVSGSTIQIGNNTISGSNNLFGNNKMSGSNTIIGNTYMTGSVNITGSQTFVGNQQLTGSLTVSGSTIQIGDNTLQGNTKLSGSVTITGSMYLTGSGGVGFINSRRILTDLDSGSFAITGSNVFISGQTITGSVNVTGSITVTDSLFMGGTAQTYISAVSITNPSNYVIHQFLTSSYHGATYAFSVVEDSTKKTTVYSNYVVAQGNNKISSNIGGDSQVTSEVSSPNPSFTIAISGSYAQFKVTDTGTFTYRGIVQLY